LPNANQQGHNLAYTQGCPRVSPRNGWEPKYEPDRWNARKEVRETHNCFAYAMNVHDPKQFTSCLKSKNCNVPFHQPGSASGHPKFSSQKQKTCSDMVGRLLGDNPTMQVTSFTDKCPKHTSKIALVVDADEDYHFYRQDSNGMWSHKPGGTPVTDKDADGKPIYDPKLSNRNYDEKGSKLNYDIFCSYMCVPRDRPLYLKTGGTRRDRNRSRKLTTRKVRR
jgi:hypothetical protein